MQAFNISISPTPTASQIIKQKYKINFGYGMITL